MSEQRCKGITNRGRHCKRSVQWAGFCIFHCHSRRVYYDEIILKPMKRLIKFLKRQEKAKP